MADGDVDAGDFSSWLRQFDTVLEGEAGIDVPCGDCTACCRSRQFVEIAPDEVDALDRIPGELLVPAPRRPPGHVVLGHDEQGRCPMLGETGCTIYEHRPRTCRTYDCRVFAAVDVDLDDAQPLIAERVRRWSFRYSTPEGERIHRSLRHAASTLRGSRSSSNPVELAILAIRSRGSAANQASPDRSAVE